MVYVVRREFEANLSEGAIKLMAFVSSLGFDRYWSLTRYEELRYEQE